MLEKICPKIKILATICFSLLLISNIFADDRDPLTYIERIGRGTELPEETCEPGDLFVIIEDFTGDINSEGEFLIEDKLYVCIDTGNQTVWARTGNIFTTSDHTFLTWDDEDHAELPLAFKLDASYPLTINFSAFDAVIEFDEATGEPPGTIFIVQDSENWTSTTIPNCTNDTTEALGFNTADWSFECHTISGGGTNALLDGTAHTDTVAQTISRGSLIYGNATPKWDELVIGSANKVLHSDGTDASWQTLVDGDVPDTVTINGTDNVSLASIAGSTDDTVLVNSGSAWTEKAVADCDAAGGVLNYDTTGNAFSCHTIADADVPNTISLTSHTQVGTILTGSAALDFPDPSGNNCTAGQTITVTGADVGDAVFLGVPGVTLSNNQFFPTPRVTAADTVTISMCEESTVTNDPASGTFTVIVFD